MLGSGQESFRKLKFVCINVNYTIIVKDSVEFVHKRPVWCTGQISYSKIGFIEIMGTNTALNKW